MADPKSVQRAGEFDPALLKTTVYPWFQKGYEEFKVPSNHDFDVIRKTGDKARYLIFMGTWCGDTHEQLPRFMKILNQAGVPTSQVRMFSLGRDKNAPGWTDKYKIERLPTFVVIKNDQEVGRIVETPKKTLIEDLAQILSFGN